MTRLSRMVAMAAFVVSFTASAELQAQRAGGFRGGGGVRSGGGMTARQPTVQTRPAVPTGSGLVGRPVTPFVNPPVSGFSRPNQFPTFRSKPFFNSPRNVIISPGFGFGYGYSPFLYGDPFYPYGYPYSDQYPYTDQSYVTPPQNDPSLQGQADLSYQIGQLSQEVEALRQQQAMQAQQPQMIQVPPQPQEVRPVPPPASQAASTPVVLVYRDGHRVEVQNYAIVGETMWVLDERNSSKIPLSDLDLEATRRENRGNLRFSLPSAR